MKRAALIVVLVSACGPVVGVDGDTSTGDATMIDATTVVGDDGVDDEADGDETLEPESTGIGEVTTTVGEESSGLVLGDSRRGTGLPRQRLLHALLRHLGVDATAGCPGFADGQECVAWYEDGQAPPGYEYVGACMVPA